MCGELQKGRRILKTKKVYLATPVGDPTEIDIRRNAEQAKKILESKGFEVYAPWQMHIPRAWDYPNQEWGLMVFTADLQHLQECDIVVVLSYGRIGTAGTAWEQGFAYAKGKKILVVEISNHIQSLMVVNGANAVIKFKDLNSYDFEKFPYCRTLTEQK